jgi:peptide/nickel transport system substrate-binding protein
VARRLTLSAAVAAVAVAVAGAGSAAVQQAPKRGGTLVIGSRTASEPACLNVFVVACPVAVRLLETVLPGAFEVTPDGAVRPDLVSGADIVSKRPFILVYRIRPEARWSDGVAVSARDFAFTHDTFVKHLPKDYNGALVDHLTKVKSVRALDRRTVKVVLRSRYVDWRFLFGFVLPRHALAGESFAGVWEDAIDNPKTRRAIGSGPFLLLNWERGKHLTFVRNPSYWGTHPAYLARIVFRFLPQEDIADAMRRGEIDMIDPGLAGLGAQALDLHRRPAPGVEVVSTLLNSWEHLSMRIGPGGHPALERPGVRRALAYGVDRVEIARAVGALSLAGAAAREPLHSVVFLANSRYYQPNWKGYRYRPQHAQRLLEREGCRRGADGVYVCSGVRLRLRIVTASAVDRRELTLRLVQAQLRRVGVEVELVFAHPTVLFEQIVQPGKFDLWVFGWIEDAGTAGPADVYACQARFNFTGFCDRLLTRDLVQATQILDDARRVGLLNKIDARLARAVPSLPLYQTTGLMAFSEALRGLVPGGVGSTFWNVEDWWLDD